jgi:hypothetical protein
MKANILPIIVTNHTVTIAAELVSLSFLNGSSTRQTLCRKENGSKLVGQCEISHPVNPSSSFGEDGEDPPELEVFSPLDGMGESIPYRSNVMYNQTDKDYGYEPLKAKISSG